MQLSELLAYDDIVIQCHDFPDADAIAAGYGVYVYLKSFHKEVRLIYSGTTQITKPNLTLMIKHLQIPIEYVSTLDSPELLITVDCCYGEGNVNKFDASHMLMTAKKFLLRLLVITIIQM